MKPQKVQVLAQKDGQIIAVQTIPLGSERLSYGTGSSLTALPEQMIYEIEAPKELMHHDVSTLHCELFGYQVEVQKNMCCLIRKPV
ncbi:hypothetical protein [Methyloglobulus sp.]|jgi:hypothetical protein|uniref:hypothetical protein n=1 Tax=Methyloglobulus sp. TaxID=2518622 RepID=UPI0032B817FB